MWLQNVVSTCRQVDEPSVVVQCDSKKGLRDRYATHHRINISI